LSIPEPEGLLPPRLARVFRACDALLLLALVIVLSATAFYTVFSIFETYDDIGFLMLSQKSFFAGHPLYDETFTQYGPAYYVLQQFFHQVVRVPLSHDSTLLFAAGSWVLTSLLCAAYVARLTRNVFMTALTCFIVFCVLTVLKGSPGHPEELCCVLLAGILLASSYLTGARVSGIVLGIIGFLVGLLIMTKANIGGFAVLGTWMCLGSLAVPKTTRNLVFGTGALAALITPLVLMRYQLNHGSGTYCLLVSGAVLLLAAQLAMSSPDRVLSWKHFMVTAAGFSAAVLACAVYALARGTSVGGLLHGVLLQHLGYDRAFYIPPAFPLRLVLWSLVLALAVWFASGPGRGRREAVWFSSIAKCAIAPLMVLMLAVTGPTMLSLTAPTISPAFIWCLPMVAATLFRSSHQPESAGESMPRRMAGSLAILTALMGYPTWGTQGPLSFFLLVPAAMVCTTDGFRHGPWQFQKTKLSSTERKKLWAISCMGLVGILWVGCSYAGKAASVYHRFGPTDFRGTRLLHMPRKQADLYRRILQSARTHGPSFFTMPGLGSLNFWADKNPPTTWNAGNWMMLLNAKEQSKLVQDLEKTPDLCVIRLKPVLNFWIRDHDISTNKVVRYVEDNFTIVESFDDCDILVRRSSTPSESKR
jgi:hypothetical protein